MLVSDIINELEKLEDEITSLRSLVEDQVKDDELNEAERNLFKLKNKVAERNNLKHSRIEFVKPTRDTRQ